MSSRPTFSTLAVQGTNAERPSFSGIGQGINLNPLNIVALDDKGELKSEGLYDPIDDAPDTNEDEKVYLKALRAKLPREKFDEQYKVVTKQHERQNPNSFFRSTKYYIDDEGLSHPLSMGEKPPRGTKIESAFGNSISADDDNPLNTFAKDTYNAFLEGFVKAPAHITNLISALATGEESEIANSVNTTIDRLKFETSVASKEKLVSPKAFESLAEFVNGENWNPTADNLMASAGSAVGSLLSFIGGAGIAGKAAKSIRGAEKTARIERAAAAGDRLAKIQRITPAFLSATAISLGEPIKAAQEAGLSAREAYAMAAVTAPIIAAMELAIGGQELMLIGKSPIRKFTTAINQAGISKLERDAAGKITKESMEAAYKEMMAETAKAAAISIREFGRQVGGEALEEVSQQYAAGSIEQLYDVLGGERKYGTDITSSESAALAFEAGIGGAMGGIFGGGMQLIGNQGKMEQQSLSIYGHVKNGTDDILKAQLDQLVGQGKLTLEGYEAALVKIDAYKGYNESIKNFTLNEDQKRTIFELSYQAENFKAKADELKDQVEQIKSEGRIPDNVLMQGIQAAEDQVNSYNKEIRDILKGKKEEAKLEEPAEESVYGRAETVNMEPEGAIESDKIVVTDEETGEVFEEDKKTGAKSVLEELKEELEPEIKLPVEIEEEIPAPVSEREKEAEIKDVVLARRDYNDENLVYAPDQESEGVSSSEDILYEIENFDEKNRDTSFSQEIKTVDSEGNEVLDFKVEKGFLHQNPVKRKAEYSSTITAKQVPVYRVSDKNGVEYLIAIQEPTPAKDKKGRGVGTFGTAYLMRLDKEGKFIEHTERIYFKNKKKDSNLLLYDDLIYGRDEKGALVKNKGVIHELGLKMGDIVQEKVAAEVNQVEIIEKSRKEKDEQATEFIEQSTSAEEDQSIIETIESKAESESQEQRDEAIREVDEIIGISVEDQKREEVNVGDIVNFNGSNYVVTEILDGGKVSLWSEEKKQRLDIDGQLVLSYLVKGDILPPAEQEKKKGVKPEEPPVKYKEEETPPITEVEHEKIRERLHRLFPEVKIFEDANAFAAHLAKHHPGVGFDPNVMGAAVKGAIYINPKAAKQTTLVHEMAHLYWDALPENDSVKKALLKLFHKEGDTAIETEERVVSALEEEGFKQIRKGSKGFISRFMALSKLFFAKVKKLFGGTDELIKKRYVEYMADRLINRRDDVSLTEGAGEIKYSKAKNRQEVVGDIIEKIQNKVLRIGNTLFRENPDGTKDRYFSFLDIQKIITGSESPTTLTENSNSIEYLLHLYIEKFVKYGDHKTALSQILSDLVSLGGEKVQERIDMYSKFISDKEQIDKLEAIAKDFTKKHIKSTDKVFSGVLLANDSEQIGGIADLIIVSQEGKAKIFQFKSHEVKDGKKFNDTLDKILGKFLSVKTIYGRQLGVLAHLLQLGNVGVGSDLKGGIEVEAMSIVPIEYETEQGKVKNVTIEDAAPLSPEVYIPEAKDMIKSVSEVLRDNVIKKITDTKSLNLHEFAQFKGYDLDKIDQQVKVKKKEIDALKERIDSEKDDAKKSKLTKKLEKAEIEFKTLEFRKRRIEKEYYAYRYDLKEVQDFFKKRDISEYSYEKLKRVYEIIARQSNLIQQAVIGDVLANIGLKLAQMQDAALAAKGKKTKRMEDFDYLEVLTEAFSTVPEDHPAMQGLRKKYAEATQKIDENYTNLVKKTIKLSRAILKDRMSGFEKIKRFVNPFSQDAKYYQNLYDENGNFKTDKHPQWKDLLQSEKDFLTFWNNHIEKEYGGIMQASSRGYVYGMNPGGNPQFFEIQRSHGLFRAISSKLTQNFAISNALLKYKDPETGAMSLMPFHQVEERLENYSNKGILQKAKAIKLLIHYKGRAEKVLRTKFHEDDTPLTIKDTKQVYTMQNGVLVPELATEYMHFEIGEDLKLHAGAEKQQKKTFVGTRHVPLALLAFAKDMETVKHLNEIMPDILSVQSLYQHWGKDFPKAMKMFDLWVDNNVIRKKNIGPLGAKVDWWLDLLKGLTYFNVMTFSLPIGVFNLVIGKLNQLRSQGTKMASGELRLANFKKARALAKKFKIGPTDLEFQPYRNIGTAFKEVSTLNIVAGEWLIASSSFFGEMTKEQWAAYDNEGNVIPGQEKYALTSEEIDRYKQQKKNVQGNYDGWDKYGYSSFSIAMAVMQFKTWMPAFFKERFGKRYVDSYGIEHEGSYKVAWQAIATMRFTEIAKIFGLNKDVWNQDTLEMRNHRKNFRELMMMATLLGMWAVAHGGDDDEKEAGKYILKLVSDMTFQFNPTTAKTLTNNMVPALTTLGKFGEAVGAIITLDTFDKDTRYNKKGDLKGAHKIFMLTPYHNLVLPLTEEEKKGKKN